MSKNILIAEDSSVILNLTKKILEQENYNISAAKNGQEVLNKLADNDYDLILMDINIPGIDGIEALRRLKASTETTHIPVIAVTANAMTEDIERGKKLDFLEYVTKPIQLGEFKKLLEKTLFG